MQRCCSSVNKLRRAAVPFRRQYALSAPSVNRQRVSVAQLLQRDDPIEDVEVNGWIRSLRKQKRIAFAAVSDGSTSHSVQAVLKPNDCAALSVGAAVTLSGSWQASMGGKQSHELQAKQVRLLGDNDAEGGPVQPKYQTAEFLRTIPHLRSRIPMNTLLLRLRSQVIATTTRFFSDTGFIQTHPPIITSSDCEGAGEAFTVVSDASSTESKTVASSKNDSAVSEHFFRTPKYLTVSSQLHLEALAQAVTNVWTLSPTFRAEKSDTPRHLSEFYMLEAEMCFTSNMDDVMDLVENMLRAIATDLQQSRLGAELLESRTATLQPKTDDSSDEKINPKIDADVLRTRWAGMATGNWPRITYTQAIRTIQEAVDARTTSFMHAATFESGLQAEHERFLAQHVGRGQPVFVTDYPRAQKPFYMSSSTSASAEGTDTVACFDLLVPELCELAGGSMREHDLQALEEGMRAKGVVGANLEWYRDLRRYGSVPHGGFGLGFDRLLCYLGGVASVRDVVAFPRWYGRCDC